jgi:hypothetical protein
MADRRPNNDSTQIISPPSLVHHRAIWGVKVSVTMRDAWLVRGYLEAVRRLVAAADASATDAGDLCIALFEATNWLDSIASRHGLGNPDVQALRFVRQRTHHGWAAAVSYDRALSDWTWSPRENLPDPSSQHEKPELERLYVELLAGKPVRDAFDRIEGVIRRTAPESPG